MSLTFICHSNIFNSLLPHRSVFMKFWIPYKSFEIVALHICHVLLRVCESCCIICATQGKIIFIGITILTSNCQTKKWRSFSWLSEWYAKKSPWEPTQRLVRIYVQAYHFDMRCPKGKRRESNPGIFEIPFLSQLGMEKLQKALNVFTHWTNHVKRKSSAIILNTLQNFFQKKRLFHVLHDLSCNLLLFSILRQTLASRWC